MILLSLVRLEGVEPSSRVYETPALTIKLQAHKNLWAIKDSGSDLNQLAAYQDENKDIDVFCGNDDCLPDWVEQGAVGCVSVVSLLWPKELHTYMTELLAGNNDKDSDALWHARGVAIGHYGNPVTIKAALRDKKIILSAYCRPPLSQCIATTLPNILQ